MPSIIEHQTLMTRRTFIVLHLERYGVPFWDAMDAYALWRDSHPDADLSEKMSYVEWETKHYAESNNELVVTASAA